MEQVTVGPKYQIVIPKSVRRKIKGLKPGSKVSVKAVDDETVKIKTEPEKWLERTYGLMSDAWRGVDTEAELKKIKNEWEERLNEFEKNK